MHVEGVGERGVPERNETEAQRIDRNSIAGPSLRRG